ncbi:ABC transporter ATP-binding protein [Vibrio crassostreae]|uniref:ABC transporter ATP-binding protein n=1 Tax=Vibrio crassostreae TaxID=246167 RepID=UPI00104ED8EA|nr:ABC transporter ATP-binding protein [Vibrio crassostreae]TCN92803.1 lipopolysaccharide transport system ATP-binding protein [Vibrio crassostreae]CAK1931492.1 O-antigen export system ATP-binding protein RfbB [Vibrio crassostreae]CAK1939713.1 O-antigen export system ATP-binding protein RfbB [Vibrio crassostreae]CAK1945132.1 O-antigen export system ATP-binding protein RfbB [Vibrio crassostreae]CAK2712274.1 O-antigen export system ATP-binding protein RfbB [Vibrio crassostreae]
MEELIKLSNVSLTYKLKTKIQDKLTYTPLNDVSFTLYEGETLGVLGRNGAGKSSLLKLLSGILKPNSGQIYFKDGLSVSMLSLQVGFDQNLSGYDNIILSSILSGFSRKKIDDNIENIIKFSELNDFIHQPVKSYSSGMKAKLGFSIAVKVTPDVLLIDEALSVGDVAFKKKAELAITEKIKSDQTVVFVSHSLGQVERLCDRVIWIEDGLVRKIGKPEQVIEAYKEYFDK